MSNFIDYRDHVGSRQEKFYKTGLFESSRLMLGLNCLEPGQSHRVHSHAGQDKFYLILEGSGSFTVGEESRGCSPGTVVWAPAAVPHGVANDGEERLVVLMGMAPPPTGS